MKAINPGTRNPERNSLLIPVLIRAVESGKTSPVLDDPHAAEIMLRLDPCIADLISQVPELYRIALVLKCRCIDRLIRDFILRYPRSGIVNLGCGLDTAFERLNNGSVLWYDLDLPGVIAFRKEFLKESGSHKFVAASLTDTGWQKNIRYNENVLFVANNLFWRLGEESARSLITGLIQTFPRFEIIMDVVSAHGAWIVNRILRDADTDRVMWPAWGLRNSKTLLSWSPRIIFLGKYKIFRQSGISLLLKYRILGRLADMLHIQYVIHLKVRRDYRHFNIVHSKSIDSL
jgi:O-methyltransferase involved in polyketide biosynthesis